MKLKSIIIAVLSLLATAANATLTTGYYRLVSYNGKYLTENTNTYKLVCSDLGSSYSQVWHLDVSGTTVTLQNVLTERYIKGQGVSSYQYETSTTSTSFTIGQDNDVYTFKYDPYNFSPGGLHCDANLNVVQYDITEEKSKWAVEAVATIDAAALASERDLFSEAAATALEPFFTDMSCSELKDAYISMSDADLRANMSQLPTSVQDMAVKVKNNAWTTYAGWSKTERSFRVASYKAYSSHEQWPGILGYGYAFGRLTNPTGIYVEAGDVIQVYVGDIPANQVVQLEVAGVGQAVGTTYYLKRGMSTLLMSSSGNCFVRYEVSNGTAPYTALTEYPDVTVHIEGGTVQGCFDLTRGDTNIDFEAMKAYLLTKPTVCLKSSTHVFNLERDYLVSALGTDMKVKEMMDVWSAVAQLEDRLTGRSDFDAYCNNLYSVTGNPAATGNPYATTYGTYYARSAYEGIFNADALMQNVGGLWTIAHEQGHNRQQLIKLAGTTEISNNVFSNAALDWQGRFTSRVNSLQSTFARWQQGLSWLERVASEGTWECLHMYVQLYQYFHQGGHDPDFYPNLFRALRANPLTLTAGTPMSAATDYLQFYETCCDVAQRDLTEFFEVYGFFTLPPAQTPQTINGVSTGTYFVELNDYQTYYVYVTQEMIDAAKGRVAAKGYQKCNLIFVEDRVTAPLATYDGHSSGELRQLSMQDDVTAFGQVGQTGQYDTFSATCSDYTYALAGTTVTMSGTGAVGFKVYDAAGTLRGVYNTYTFTLPDGIGEGYSIKAAAGDGSDVAATYAEGAAMPESDVVFTDNANAVVAAADQVAAESSITSGRAYLVYYPGSGQTPHSGYITDTGSEYSAQDNPTPTLRDIYVFKSNGDGTWNVQNCVTGNYWGVPPATNSTAYAGSDTPGAWSLNFSGNTMYPSCPDANGTDHSWNRSSGKIHPWSLGTADANRLQLFEVEYPIELDGQSITVGSDAAATLATDQWYVMFDRGTSPHSHGYLYENGSNKLMNTATAPSGSATANAQYLVRVVSHDGAYYLQTGLGNYFGTIEQSTNVATTATPSSPVVLKKIGGTDGHYYIKSAATGIILDANSLENGDATVVGWGTTAPTSTGGNNDWAFYPVTLEAATDSRYIADQTPLNAVPTAAEGWYAIRVKSHASYANYFLYPAAQAINYSGTLYPLTFYASEPQNPTIDEVAYYFRLSRSGDYIYWQMPDGRYLYATGNKFPLATTEQTAISLLYDANGFRFSSGGRYAVPYYLGQQYFVGETATSDNTYYDIYPINLAKAGLTAWKVVIPSAVADIQLTCTRDDVSGLTAVYNGGYFFLPANATPASTDFALEGMQTCAIDADAHTITVEYDPTIALLSSSVSVAQGWQTVGRGGEVQLLRITVSPMKAATQATIDVTLKDGSEASVTKLTLYEASTGSSEILSTGTGAPAKTAIATSTVSGSAATLAIGDLSAGDHYYWLAATVTDDATLGAVIDAAATAITYTCGDKETTLDLSATGDPEARGAMVFDVQTYPFLPRDNDSRVYRIPAMTVADDGSIIAAVDKRYDSHTDIGNGHVIDIVVRRSTDGGRTWGEPVVVAKGQGTSDNARCGYGDPSLVKGNDGTLYCLFAAGNIGYFYGLNRVCLSRSTDNGQTWSTPVDLYEQGLITDHATSYGSNACYGLYDYFVTSGRCLCTSEGYLMGLLPAQPYTDAEQTAHTSNSHDYIFYSTDQGATWHISDNAIFTGGDEAKVIQTAPGELLASVRQANNRGFNTATYALQPDGTLAFTMGTQWNNAQLNAGGYANNQDIFYFQRETDEGKTDVIFHSMTTGQHANLKLYYSTDKGRNWTEFLNVQTKGTRYVTMEKSPAGSLYLLFEDQSLNSAGGYTDYNHYPINFLEITREQLVQLIPAIDEYQVPDYLETKVVKNSVYQMSTGCDTYGTFSGTGEGHWARTWTSNASSGVAGLTVSTESGYGFDKATLEGTRVMTLKPSADGATDTYTITAPAGYLISGYTVGGIVYQSGSYRITAADGTTTGNITSTTTPKKMTVSNVNASSTTFTFYGASQSNWFAFTDFTVTLAKTFPLNVVGDASYATLYLPVDVTTDGTTKAYYVATATNGKAQLTATDNGGTAIPARTAVVLINSEAATTTAFTRTSGLSSVVSEDANLLKGTFVSRDLDLSLSTDNYSMGVLDGNIGFYKFDDGLGNANSTIITLAANKAYLVVPSSAGNGVKGFTLTFGSEDGIRHTEADEGTASDAAAIYNLSGQRVAQPTRRGIYIVGGKKVVVR